MKEALSRHRGNRKREKVRNQRASVEGEVKKESQLDC